MITLLETLADWRDELRSKLANAHHTLGPRRFVKLSAEVVSFKRVCAALANDWKRDGIETTEHQAQGETKQATTR